MTENFRCETDLDCPTNFLCYSQTSINSTLSQNSTGCFCNTFYGWEGKDCTTWSFETGFFFIWSLLLTLILTYTFFLLFEIFCIFLVRNRFHFSWNLTFCTVLLTTIANLGAFLFCLSSTVSTGKVKGSFLAKDFYFEQDPYKGRHNIYGFLGAGISCGNLFLVSALWVEAGEKARRRLDDKGNSILIKRYKKFCIGFVIFGTLFGSGSGIFSRFIGNKSNILGFVLLPMNIIMWLMFTLGAFYLQKAIEEISKPIIKDTSKDKESIEDILLIKDSPFPDSWFETTKDTIDLEQQIKKKPPFVGKLAERMLKKNINSQKFLQTDNTVSKEALITKENTTNNPKYGRELTTEENIKSKKKFSKKVGFSRRTKVETQVDNKESKAALELLRTTSLYFSFGLFIFSIVVDFSLSEELEGNGWRENALPGKSFPIIKFLDMFVLTGIVIILITAVRYLRYSAYKLDIEETNISIES
eukprot:snap_masked-scaffold_71-processed-gene-0.48-mRNA-1 protein AED:1.00 eAED:1.00 QI:0/0/0/0/1/1/3/0/471